MNPEYVLVPIEHLHLPEVVIDQEYVARLIKDFNPDRMGPIYAKKRRDGTYMVTDGVHRAVAAAAAGEQAVRVYPHA